MTDDLVNRLLDYDKRADWSHVAHPEVCLEAAERIEALEAALREIMEVSDQNSYGFAFDRHAAYFRMARAALAGEKKDGCF